MGTVSRELCGDPAMCTATAAWLAAALGAPIARRPVSTAATVVAVAVPSRSAVGSAARDPLRHNLYRRPVRCFGKLVPRRLNRGHLLSRGRIGSPAATA